MKGQNFASQVLSRHTFRISRKKGSDFFDHRGTLKKLEIFCFSIVLVMKVTSQTIPNPLEAGQGEVC